MKSSSFTITGAGRDSVLRWILLAIYVIVALGGFAFIYLFQRSSTEYQTTRTLSVNHRIVPGDVETAYNGRFLVPSLSDTRDFEGRYVQTDGAAVSAGAPISLEQTGDRPQLRPFVPASSYLFWVTIADPSSGESQGLDADERADLCGAGAGTAPDPCFRDVRIAAVSCDRRVPPVCSAGVWLDRAQRTVLNRTLNTAPGKQPNVWLVPRHGSAAPFVAAGPVSSDEAATAAYLDSIRATAPERLSAFFAALPKGADLHNHASGAVYAEVYLAWAQHDGGCFNRTTLVLTSTCTTGAGQRITEGIAAEPNFGKDVVSALSMANFVPKDPKDPKAAHDHFFGAFARFGPVADAHRAGVIAAATSDAARQHVDVLELMLSAASGKSRDLARRFGRDGNPAFSESDFAADARVLDKDGGFATAVAAGKKELQASDKRRRALMRCNQKKPDPGCAVDLHYILQVLRSAPPEEVFTQTRVAMAIASDPASRAVAINYVAPEVVGRATTDYALHMRIVQYLHARYPRARISLHAGELTAQFAPPDALRDHIRTAVEVAGAARIGHGVDVLGETNADQLLSEMAARRTLVEVALTSNDVILNVRGTAHPLPAYLERGVPVALVTDDAGISRSDLSHEFLRAETAYAFPYATLKKLVRNSVEYAFLAGGSLWSDPSYTRRVAACAVAVPTDPVPTACNTYLNANPRAAAEFKLENELREFEATKGRGR
jgi:adenosine deaminase